MSTNTSWEKMDLQAETAKYLRGTHTMYSRISDDEHIFLVLPNGQLPYDTYGGYYSIATALQVKGMMAVR